MAVVLTIVQANYWRYEKVVIYLFEDYFAGAYFGRWNNGERNGYGSFMLPCGLQIAGVWRNGQSE